MLLFLLFTRPSLRERAREQTERAPTRTSSPPAAPPRHTRAHTRTQTKISGSVDKKTVLENLDLALLAIDEVVDRGLILETDPATVAQRASMAGAEGEAGASMGGLGGLAAAGGPLSEQTLSKVMASAKEQLARSLLK